MRPTRLLVSICFVFLTIFLTFYSLLHTHSRNNGLATSDNSKHGFSAFFSFHTPSTLFPPSAIISLTDDNSTFFLGRPADYGQSLPTDGLSGQLWIGSGFGEDALTRGGAISKAEGELGCSDIPGWTEGQAKHIQDHVDEKGHKGKEGLAAIKSSQDENQSRKGSLQKPDRPATSKAVVAPKEDDGTDAHLHYPLKEASVAKAGRSGEGALFIKENRAPEHADIQSLQESGEIAGKVVLLSRGGCGFLEKTKWVQRRGGVALIVADNTRGGPLIVMYAHGDSSNISIPSLFTTRTTAHLLSSLIPPRAADGSDILATPDSKAAKASYNKTPGKKDSILTTKSTAASEKSSRSAARSVSKVSRDSGKGSTSKSPNIIKTKGKTGWFSSLATKFGAGRKYTASGPDSDSSRPPSSGRLDWVVSESWDDEPISHPIKGGSSKGASKAASQNNAKDRDRSKPSGGDGFVIGVQDWRDPDILKSEPKQSTQKGSADSQITDSKATVASAKLAESKGDKELAGGSITPGSGVYHDSTSQGKDSTKDSSSQTEVDGKDASADNENDGWFRLFRGTSTSAEDQNQAQDTNNKNAAPYYVKENEFDQATPGAASEHEGLWVTMTPTSLSSTPFFDTLLVLVVSPLVTLTVVYALLILRGRIRRRRWRAPKSVVERLPVRTYHTMSCSSSTSSSQASSPDGSSPSSPLLQASSQNVKARTRPRSRTTSTLAENVAASLTPEPSPKSRKSPKSPTRRDNNGPSRRWRYRGRQVECVVCLEEYVDGQSQVMSLPCGHEFHAECITPWLTTRRRTCPICKGDVVRSLATASSSSSMLAQSPNRRYFENPNPDDVQALAAETSNESPSSAIPIPRSTLDADLERGDDLAETLVNDRSPGGGWRELISRSFSAYSGEASSAQSRVDRDR